MMDLNVEQYISEHQERVRRLDELNRQIESPQYSKEEKENFREEVLKLCLTGLATV